MSMLHPFTDNRDRPHGHRVRESLSPRERLLGQLLVILLILLAIVLRSL